MNDQKRIFMAFSFLAIMILVASFFIHPVLNFINTAHLTIPELMFSVLIFIGILLITPIHELFHWFGAKIVGVKNKAFGISPLIFFVNPIIKEDMPYYKIKKFYILLSGATYSILSAIIVFGISILYFPFSITQILYPLIIGAILINIFNLVPLFGNSDGDVILRDLVLHKDTTKINVAFIFIIPLIMTYFEFTTPIMSLNIIIYNYIEMVVMFSLMFFLMKKVKFKKLDEIVNSSPKGRYFIKNYLMMFWVF
ncbi:MAG: hypothetical protein ACP5IV_07900 [Caldisericia bacterium]